MTQYYFFMKKFHTIGNDSIDSRLDRWFKRKISKVPQSLIEKSLRKGNIKVNGKKEKSSYKLQNKDIVTIHNLNFISDKHNKKSIKYVATKNDLTNSTSIFIENNQNFAVINKPAGIAVQSGTKSRRNILDILRYTKEFNGLDPYTVHRIDKETTGILIVAKNRKYAQLFTTMFRLRKINKIYLCIIKGEMDKPNGRLNDILYYYEGEKKIKHIAITNYNVIDSNNNYSLLQLNPETGRKHQLRKQLLIHGKPILGDTKYTISHTFRNHKNKLMLHAYKINFSINDKKFKFLAELPTEFKKTLKEKYLKIY